MIRELRIYGFRTGGLDIYLPLAGGIALDIRGPQLGILKGFWLTKRGDTDVAVHIWDYESLDHRQAVRESLAGNARWNDEFLTFILPTLKSQEVRFLSPASDDMPKSQASSSYSLQTFEAPPDGLAHAVQDARRRLSGEPSGSQVHTGISPWPNSVCLLLRGSASGLFHTPPEGSVLRERLDMAASAFSPLK